MSKKNIKIKHQSEQKLAVIKIESPKRLVCPEWSSNIYMKAGFGKGKQRYECKKCGRQFVENPRREPTNKIQYPENFEFESNLWLAEHLGLKKYGHESGKSKSFNFSSVRQEWLRYFVKKFILYSASIKSLSTNLNYLKNLSWFSLFLEELRFNGSIQDVDRKLITDYISYLARADLSCSYRLHILCDLSLFFETGLTNNWFQVQPYLIRAEDYPKEQINLPRYLPEKVLQQLNQNLDKLPKPVMRMVLVLEETGLRIGELCQLRFNCLKPDGKGKHQIQFMRWKMKKEDALPISSELTQVIQEQQQYIRDNIGDFEYLFCGIKSGYGFQPDAKIMTTGSFTGYLKRLAKECAIKDDAGKLWNFQSHQFRHTVGTRMINAGVPQHIVQRYLGHESPEMTMVYAHIFDDTLRQELEKYHESRVVNFQGETVELEETILSSNDDLEWFKKNVQARALEHGYCARPRVLGDCDIPGFDGCYNCPFWRTNKNFLPILQDTLDRTNKVLEKARNCGWKLQVKKNEPIKHNLEKVVNSLDVVNDE